MRDEDLIRSDLEEARQRRNRFSRQIHEGHWLEQPDRPIWPVHACDKTVVAAIGNERRAELARDLVNPPEPGVVPSLFVFRAGVAQADKQSNHRAIIDGG